MMYLYIVKYYLCTVISCSTVSFSPTVAVCGSISLLLLCRVWSPSLFREWVFGSLSVRTSAGQRYYYSCILNSERPLVALVPGSLICARRSLRVVYFLRHCRLALLHARSLSPLISSSILCLFLRHSCALRTCFARLQEPVISSTLYTCAEMLGCQGAKSGC